VIRLVVIAVVIFIALSVPIVGEGDSRSHANNAAAVRTDYLPKIDLVDQTGRLVSLASLRSRPLLIGFMHTECKGPCELMTARMKRVAQNLGRRFDSKVTMISITTDPDDDGPEQLLAYAKAQGADVNGWLFLTGQPPEVRRVLALYNVPHESEEDEMTHVSDLYLIAPDGRKIHQYRGAVIPPETIASDIDAFWHSGKHTLK
jgi:protein SCO1